MPWLEIVGGSATGRSVGLGLGEAAIGLAVAVGEAEVASEVGGADRPQALNRRIKLGSRSSFLS
jgi:hypothetical protein